MRSEPNEINVCRTITAAFFKPNNNFHRAVDESVVCIESASERKFNRVAKAFPNQPSTSFVDEMKRAG